MELREEKFDYEIKDFKPTIRKNPKSRKLKIAISAVAGVLVLALCIFLYKTLIYREKLSPKEAVSRSLTDLLDHMVGDKTYVAKEGGYEGWFDYTSKNPYVLQTSVKLRDIGDLPIDVGEYIKGISLKTDILVDKKAGQFSGELEGAWTLFNINVAQYMGEKGNFYIGSKEFFKESLLISPGKHGILSTPINDLVKGYLDYDLPDLEAGSLSFNDIIKEITPKLEYKELEGKKSITVAGKEVKAYGIEVTAKIDAYEEPIVIEFYMNKDYQLLQLVATLKDKKNDLTFTARCDFSGSKHPSDNTRVKLTINYKDIELGKGELKFENVVKNKVLDNKISGYFNIPGIDYTFDQLISYDLSENTFSASGSYSDGVDVLKLETKGSVKEDKEEDKLSVKLDKFTITYSEKMIAVLNFNVKLAKTDEAYEGVKRPSDVVDVFDMSEAEKESIMSQIQKKLEDYKKLFEEMMSY